MRASDNNFYFVHGLFCEEISEPFRMVRQFLDEHPKEFVILDCQHFYNFANGDYGRLERIIFNILGDLIYGSKHGSLQELTLSHARSLDKRVLVIYRYGIVPEQFWPSDSWPTPWPNQCNLQKLEKYLDFSLTQRSQDTGFVTQCVLTPPVQFILPRYIYKFSILRQPQYSQPEISFANRFLSSLRHACAQRVIKGLTNWISAQQPGSFENNSDKAPVNVFIADFVELKDHQFCRIVIELNYKILEHLIRSPEPIELS